MPYLGNNLGVAFSSYKLIDSLTASFNGTTTSFALTVNGVTPVPFPLNEQNILISVGGVPQKPDSTGTEGFRFSGSNIVFSSAPKTGEAFWGVVLAGADRVNAGVQYPDGTASVPSITFASQTTTGFYRSGSGQIGVGINGSTPVAFSTSGVQLNGSTSGSVIIASPAVAGNNTLTLPTSNGSANQFLKNGATAGSLGYSSMVEDSSGRVGIGTTSPAQLLHVSGSGTQAIRLENTLGTGNVNLELKLTGNTFKIGQNNTSLYFEDTAGREYLWYQGANERMRIHSNGTVAINNTNSTYFLEVTGSSVIGGLRVQGPGSGGNYPALFRDSDATSGFQQLLRIERGGSQVGHIGTTNTSTTYSTSSDYRLKENVKLIAGATSRILQLKPSRFNFIADPDHTVDGFIAHEAQAVVPECVTGEKDAVDADGNPVMQGIDQSKLVPLLTAALQEAIGEIKSLKDRVAALEAS